MTITREQGQNMVSEQYRRHRALVVIYATGFGKAKAALDAVSDHVYDPESKHALGLIICHSELARDTTWPNEIEKWMPRSINKLFIERHCYQSLKKCRGRRYHWVIMDEAQYVTEGYEKYLKDISYDGIILLTAFRAEDLTKKQIFERLSKGHTMEIGLDTAVNSGVLNNYQIRVWKVVLTAMERQDYLELCRKVKWAQDIGNEFKIRQYAGERMQFIYNLESKYKGACWLRDKVRESGKRFVIHCGSIKMANRLSPYAMHSKSTVDWFDKFCNGEINEIAAVKQLKESANVDNLQSSIIEQLNSKQLDLVQQVGRNMRLDPSETAVIHILVAKDTVDENWMNKAIKSFDKNKVTYHELDRQKIESYS